MPAGALQRLGWTTGYGPLPGVPDELIGPDGRPRAHWRRFLDALGSRPPEEIERRFAAADRHIRSTGVSYRSAGDLAEHAWPLSHIPLLIDGAEWRAIEAGVAQRAALMDAILGDLYGEGRLVRDGALPAAAVAGSPDYLRPLHGVAPPRGRALQVYAADLGRGPDGRWWVLGDRTQAPSGAGYALENRLVLSRAFPGLYRAMNVERLAAFFSGFREGLAGLAEREEPRIGLLTPGPYSDTYFEQAYLARYLGFLLVEGDDLVVHEGRVHVRTIGGLKRVDVLLRRVDGDFVDPLELNAASRLGVPGLVEAVRHGGVALANMPGSGVLEARALLGFMPALCRRILGEDLKLPHIATWWCGQARERDEVLARLGELAVESAHGGRVPGFPGRQAVLGAELAPDERARLAAAIARRGVDYVGQEVVQLSTTPVWESGRLVPRPFVLRVFAAATPEGWRVMPGGFCRIAHRPDARAVSMGEGARSCDVWVLSDRPVAETSLLPAADGARIRRIAGHLPSRAADNLFWLGRYLERAEATLRLVRALSAGLMEAAPGAGRTVARLQGLLTAWGAADAAESGGGSAVPPGASAPAWQALHGSSAGSARLLVQAAQRAASTLRERLSPDAWQAIAELRALLEPPREATPAPEEAELALDLALPGGAEADAPAREVPPAPAALPPGVALPPEAETLERAERALQCIAALSGLAQENMNRGPGWRFLDMGRRIERGVNTCRFARSLAGDDAAGDDLDALLDLVDSQITYRSRYLVGLAVGPVRDMVALDPYNPRSIAFQVGQIQAHLAELPPLRQDGMMEEPRRIVTGLAAEMATREAASLDAGALLAVEQALMSLAVAVEARYVYHGPQGARPEKLTGLA